MRTGRFLVASALTLAVCLLSSTPTQGVVTDARRSGMGGVLLPGKDLRAVNPAWNGVKLPHSNRAIPLPLGIIAGLAADTDNQDSFERTVTRLKSLYPVFEVELRPEPDISDDIEIEVGRNFLRIDLGKGKASIPSGGVEADFLSNTGLIGLTSGPLHVGLSAILTTDGNFDVDDSLRGALDGAVPLRSATTYEGVGRLEAQGVLALEMGTTVKLSQLDPGGPSAGVVYAGAGIKGLMGLGYADTRLDVDLATGDPIFDPNDPLDVTYRADLRFNQGVGWGVGFDMGLAFIQGPWLAGVSIENIAAKIHWDTEHRIEELTPAGDAVSTTLGTGERVTSKIPVVWMANGGWVTETWMLLTDIRVQQEKVNWHGGVERRFSVLAARGGLSWAEGKGFQGAVGAGVGLGKFSFDVSLRTHPYLYSKGRGLYLGASLGLPL